MKLADYVKIMGIDLRETEEIDSNELRIVANESKGKLESLDEDSSIMDVELNLDEACKFDFEKHMSSIVECEKVALEEHARKYTKLNTAQENSREYDRRYKERSHNRIRFK